MGFVSLLTHCNASVCAQPDSSNISPQRVLCCYRPSIARNFPQNSPNLSCAIHLVYFLSFLASFSFYRRLDECSPARSYPTCNTLFSEILLCCSSLCLWSFCSGSKDGHDRRLNSKISFGTFFYSMHP